MLQTAKNKKAEVDSNKQYMSELLAILMQHSEANQRSLADANGIEIILQAIAAYKNRRALHCRPSRAPFSRSL